jgi:inorganic triphosphatase YgiF
MAVELELKLALARQDAATISHHPLFDAVRPLRRRMLNTYFDTPDLRLARAHMALRLRRSGGKWLQTLKAGGGAAAGLHQRDEWEFPLPRGARAELRLAMFAGSALDALDTQELATQLQPVFSTDFMRTTWTIEPAPGTRIEIALDQGRISCGRRKQAISEIELELKAGKATALYALAEKLQQTVKLRPDSISKAERGYQLYRNTPPQPVHFAAPPLDAAMAPDIALRLVAGASLDQAERNAAGVMAGSRDAEFLHQARVALRRLRSALKLAGRDDAAAAELSARVQPIARVLGEARDWDVLLGHTLPQLLAAWRGPGGPALLARARRHRATAYEATRQVLAGTPWCAALLAMSQWLGNRPAPAAKGPSLMRFAATQLARQHNHLLRDAAGLGRQTPQQRHRARIAAKRLRYGAEAFADLFEAGGAKRYLRAIQAVQDALGGCNDAQNALHRITLLAPASGLAAFANEWLAVCEARELARAQSALARLARCRHFWKAPADGKKRRQ